jgi:hypothetical protein
MVDNLSSIRINLGGPRYLSSEGSIWHADKAYSRKHCGCLELGSTDVLTTSDIIVGTEDAPILQTVRMGEMFRYRFDLNPGKYMVCIFFAEIYWESSEAEHQDIYLNNRCVLSNYNIFDEVGHDVATEKKFFIKIRRDLLTIKFKGRSLPMHSGARASAIEVKKQS